MADHSRFGIVQNSPISHMQMDFEMYAERALSRVIYIMNMRTALCKVQIHTHIYAVNEKFTCFRNYWLGQ